MAKVRVLIAVTLLPLIALTAIATVLLWPDQRRQEVPSSLGISAPLVNGTVTRVESGPCPDDPSMNICDTVTFEVTSGPDKGRTAVAPSPRSVGTPKFEVHDKIVLGRTEVPGGQATYYISDYQRKPALGWLALAFALTVVIIGRWRGIGALIGLGFTWLVVTNFLLPSMLEGRSPVLLAVTSSALIMFVVLYVAHGLNRRTTTALLGTLVGLGLTAGLASFAVSFAYITGLSSEDVTSVQAYAGQIDVEGLLLAGIVIGSLGVLNDVTVTQASAVWEVRRANPSMSRRDLYKAGMRVGRDHVASTVYTLVLAYVGAALPLLIIFSIADRQWADAVSTDVVGEEIVRTVAGSIGLMLSVPITTALAALFADAARRDGAGGEGDEDREPLPSIDPSDSGSALATVGASLSTSVASEVDVEEKPTGSHFAIDSSASSDAESAEPEIRTDNESIAAEPEENGLINPAAYPPVPKKKRFGLGRRNTEFNRKMSRRERKFWGDEAE